MYALVGVLIKCCRLFAMKCTFVILLAMKSKVVDICESLLTLQIWYLLTDMCYDCPLALKIHSHYLT